MLAQATAALRPRRVWDIQKRLQFNEPRQGFGVPISKLPPLRDATRPATASPSGKASCAG
jgi:hypothetical protein